MKEGGRGERVKGKVGKTKGEGIDRVRKYKGNEKGSYEHVCVGGIGG